MLTGWSAGGQQVPGVSWREGRRLQHATQAVGGVTLNPAAARKAAGTRPMLVGEHLVYERGPKALTALPAHASLPSLLPICDAS